MSETVENPNEGFVLDPLFDYFDFEIPPLEKES